MYSSTFIYDTSEYFDISENTVYFPGVCRPKARLDSWRENVTRYNTDDCRLLRIGNYFWRMQIISAEYYYPLRSVGQLGH